MDKPTDLPLCSFSEMPAVHPARLTVCPVENTRGVARLFRFHKNLKQSNVRLAVLAFVLTASRLLLSLALAFLWPSFCNNRDCSGIFFLILAGGCRDGGLPSCAASPVFCGWCVVLLVVPLLFWWPLFLSLFVAVHLLHQHTTHFRPLLPFFPPTPTSCFACLLAPKVPPWTSTPSLPRNWTRTPT